MPALFSAESHEIDPLFGFITQIGLALARRERPT